MKGNPDRWFSFKYERLSGVCYKCGCIDNLESWCDAEEPHPFSSKLEPLMKTLDVTKRTSSTQLRQKNNLLYTVPRLSINELLKSIFKESPFRNVPGSSSGGLVKPLDLGNPSEVMNPRRFLQHSIIHV